MELSAIAFLGNGFCFLYVYKEGRHCYGISAAFQTCVLSRMCLYFVK